MTDKALKNIYLNEFHKSKDAKFAAFAGYDMPINYKTGIINEHLHVRNSAGIFDISHMGQVLIPKNNINISALETCIPLDIKNIAFNKCHYSFILNSNGGIIDDVMLSKIQIDNEDNIYIVYNASRKNILNKIFKKIVLNFNVIEDRCLIAIQGPDSYASINSILNLSNLMKFLDIDVLKYQSSNLYISRSGYTGEDGFEISVLNHEAKDLVQQILNNSNTILCGLGCRDSLRVEAGLSLYGNEINEDITPIQAGLSWALHKRRLKDKKLNCHEILTDQLNFSKTIKKIGLTPVNKTMLRSKMTLHDGEENEIGYITSGCYSPTLKKSIGIGYINHIIKMSEKIYVKVRGNFEEIILVNIPFIKKNYKKGD